MHVVFLNQYYPPDHAPTGLMLEAVAEALCEMGHDVTIVCGQGGYATADESRPGNKTTGTPTKREPRILSLGGTSFGRKTYHGKLIDYFTFYAATTWSLFTMAHRPDRIVALTTPPYLSLLARLASKARGGDHAHWVMDLYPDVMVAHGIIGEKGLPHRMLAWLARIGFGGKRCAHILTIGPDMVDRISALLRGKSQPRWVALWGTDVSTSPAPVDPEPAPQRTSLREARGWKDDEIVLMYSGNMGLGHRFDEFLKAAEKLAHPDHGFRFVFFGGGKRAKEIEAFISRFPTAQVELHPYVSRELLQPHLESADIHLASLEPAWSGTMVPSKLQGIFSVGKPVIFLGDPRSSIGTWIESSGGGWTVAPGEMQRLEAVLLEARDAECRHTRGAAARAFHEEHFSKATNSTEIARLLASP